MTIYIKLKTGAGGGLETSNPPNPLVPANLSKRKRGSRKKKAVSFSQPPLITYRGGSKIAPDTYNSKKKVLRTYNFLLHSKSSDKAGGGVNGEFFLIKSKRNGMGLEI